MTKTAAYPKRDGVATTKTKLKTRKNKSITNQFKQMIMKKVYLILAAAVGMTITSCTTNDYLGEDQGTNSPQLSQGTPGAIVFGSYAGKMTRATSNTGSAADMLDGQMKIFGVKKVTTGPVYTTVFDNYVVWSNTTNVTTSNPDATTSTAAENGWEYVGTSSQGYGTTPTNGTLGKDQYIKYWDYETDEYHFVAGSPVKDFAYTITAGEIASATVTGITGHLNPNTGAAMGKDPVYIAAPVKKVNNHSATDATADRYNTDVEFQFTRQQTYVRVGVYETVPGYKITSISFYEWDCANTAWKNTPQAAHNIVLNSTTTDDYFKGSTGSTTATVTYEWTTPSVSGISYGSTTNQENWYGGKLNLSDGNYLATSSTDTRKDYFYGTDSDIDANGYFVVLPTPSATVAQPIIIKCDYTLTALDGAETINVKGATAAIPAAFSKWNPNTTYTYLFKISDNTNGTTGTSGTDPEGLFPITFDAAVIAEVNGTQQGYITTVSTPSITTYQAGSVIATGVEYVMDTPIYFTAQDDEDGTLETLTAGNYATPALGGVHVFKLDAPATEADLILTRPAEGKKFTTTIGAAAWNINGQSVAASKWASFTPDAAGTYAIEYCTQASPAAFAYKVITVLASHP